MSLSPLFYLLALISSIYSLEDHYYTITRSSSDGLSNEEDVFEVPESQCSSVSSHCSDYTNAESSSTSPTCECRCLSHASTFGRHEASWSCLNNTEIRELSGCRLRFTSERDGDPFRIMKRNESPLPSVVLPSGSCSITMSSSKYFTCGGKWAKIDPYGRTSSPLLIFIKEKLSSSRHYKYSFTVRNLPSLSGKLISLQFKCPQLLQPSCLVFKMEGEFKCPVSIPQAPSTTKPVIKPTTSFSSTVPSKATDAEEKEGKRKGASNQGGGTSSGTLAAVVTSIAILVILLVVVIGIVIWRKKGQRLQIIDRLARLGRRKQLEPDENMYAEIAQKSHQRPPRTGTEAMSRDSGINNRSFEDFSSTNLQRCDDALYVEAEFATSNELVADTEGYLVPVDSPMYLELQPPKENINGIAKSGNECLNFLSDSDARNSGSHFYDVLEDPNEQSTNSNAETSSHEGDAREEPFRGSAGSSIAKVAPRPSGVRGTNGRVPKKRRSPPRTPDELKNHERHITRPDNHGEIRGKELNNGLEDNVYESLRDDERVMSLYEPLDRKTGFKK